jgi:hypothetical protein
MDIEIRFGKLWHRTPDEKSMYYLIGVTTHREKECFVFGVYLLVFYIGFALEV